MACGSITGIKKAANAARAGYSCFSGIAFVEKETFGLVKWWNLELKDRTPAWAEKETLIPAAQIVRESRAMGKAAPKTAVWMGPGVGMSPRGTYASTAVYALNGLLGSIDVEGGVWQSSSVPIAGFPKEDAYLDDVAKGASKFKKLDGRGAKDMPAMMNARPGSGVVTTNVANGMLKDPGAVKDVHVVVVEFQFLLYRTVLVISQAASPDFEPDVAIPLRRIGETVPLDLQGTTARLEAGTCDDGSPCSRIEWQEGGSQMMLTMKGPAVELVRIAQSIRR